MTDKLFDEIANVGKLIGLLDSNGSPREDWFTHPMTPDGLEGIPRRIPELVTLIQDALGDPTPAPDVFTDPQITDPAWLKGTQWLKQGNLFSIANPLDRTPTHVYVVTPPASDKSGTLGVGVMYPHTYQDLTITAYAFAPLVELSTTADPGFVLDKQPVHIGIRVTKDGGFSAPNNVTFAALTVDASLHLGTDPPSCYLLFEGIHGNGEIPGQYHALSGSSGLLAHIDIVVGWLSAVILEGTYWLHTYVGGSVFTVGDILKDACILSVDGNGDYILNQTYLQQNVSKPTLIAENFVLNVLDGLADTGDAGAPIIKIPVGDAGSGVFVTKEPAGNGAVDYGLRLMIQDITLGRPTGQTGKQKPEFVVQLGKWIAGEDEKNSWVARSLNLSTDQPKPGVSLYLLKDNDPQAHQDCTGAAPNVSFDPHIEIISLGLDVQGSAAHPVFNVDGYVLSGAELRVYLKHAGGNFTFGAAVSLDGLGLPLGPGFGAATKESKTNRVAQGLLESAPPAGSTAAKQGGDKAPVNPSFSVSAGYVEDGGFVVQLYDKDGNPASMVKIPIQRALGPLECQDLGIGWVQKDHKDYQLSLLFDGGVHLSMLDIDLMGLSIGIPVTDPSDFTKYDLDLDGLGITLDAKEVELSAALVKVPKGDPPPPTYTAYNGEAMLKAGPYTIMALGSYAYVPVSSSEGYASMFIYGVLDGELGGPEFFFVTGVAAGFGFNRDIELPGMNDVTTYPLVAAASDPTQLGATKKPGGGWELPDPAAVVSKLSDIIPPERGEYWLAAGVRFTSFDLVNATALLTVAFGNELKIAVLGLAWISLPPPPVPGKPPAEKFAYAELGIEIEVLPAQGVVSATAVLTPNSFVLDPACKLTGGFAFYAWFGDNPHSGEFVLTLGGYHPKFHPPSYYPQVPALGFSWPVSSEISIDGGAYFALTPSAAMGGAHLNLTFHSGPLRAWFKAHMNALVEWHPFYFEIDFGINIGASFRVHALFVTVTIKVSLGADVYMWGPKLGAKVHVSWYIISFTIGFGAGKKTVPPVPWENDDGTGFSQTLLPHKIVDAQSQAQLRATPGIAAQPATKTAKPSGVYTISITDGLQSTFDKNGETIWIIRPNHPEFSVVTAFPATELDLLVPDSTSDQGTTTDQYIATVEPGNTAKLCGSTATAYKIYKIAPNPSNPAYQSESYYVCIRPMKVTLSSSKVTIQLCLDDTSEPWDLVEHFDFDVVFRAVPAAKWGKPLTGDDKPAYSKMVPDRLLGLEHIVPKAPTLTPSGKALLNIHVQTAFTYDIVDEQDGYSPDHLPLAADVQPTGTKLQPDSDALTKIENALKTEKPPTKNPVTVARDELFAALQEYGMNPMAAGEDLTLFGKNPGAYLHGNPLITVSAYWPAH